MRTFRGALMAPVIVGSLITAAGCGTIAAATSSAQLVTAPSRITAASLTTVPPTEVPPSTAASASTAASPSSGASHAGAVSTPPSNPPPASASAASAFPGIWDITSWQQYRAAQSAVEQGHQPWLLDPKMVVQAWAARWALNVPVRQLTVDSFQVTEPGTHVVYTIRGTRPDPTGPAPIWVITQITHS